RGYEERAGDACLLLTLDLPRAPVWVVADPVRMAQVVGNLLHNAVKFTGPGGRVTVKLEADAQARQAALTVRDTGIGIRPEDLRLLFHDFAQIDPRYDRRPG